MGLQHTTEPADPAQMRTFVRALLEDIHALERMLAEGRFERGVRRIGAEQEMFLVDRSYRPRAAVLQVLQHLEGAPFTTELAQYNLETNMPPLTFEGDCLARMEHSLEDLTLRARMAAGGRGSADRAVRDPADARSLAPGDRVDDARPALPPAQPADDRSCAAARSRP
jgi:hypothetical protein